MKKKTSRAKQAEITKNKIYNCGVKLIRKHGFDNVTVEEIAKQAGVSVGTYYYYFESKFELFSEIYKRADDYFLKEVADKFESKDCKGKILEFFDKYAEYNCLDGIDMIKKLYTSDNKMFITKGRAMQRILEKIIDEGQRNGEIINSESPAEITRMLFIVARGVVYNWCLNDGAIDLKDEMRKIIAAMLNGLCNSKIDM
ncbi:TetR/AcrR family transcriptional regulator [Caloramator sp. E03]|uniref:TetR/AcrR family transcriptional regulator n=1 Tax=Caloramator sp. E03 TaxID=2576307 RepID=UPI001110759C|nr:TetR/AcrR family transcriptional regulator [Caloramator sp. E03]QCX34178.1 TetR/AcrR family transcriptional regulator [Caloramator sp. E03]